GRRTGPLTNGGPAGAGSRRPTVTTVPTAWADGATAPIRAAAAASFPGARAAPGNGGAVTKAVLAAAVAARTRRAGMGGAFQLGRLAGGTIGLVWAAARAELDDGFVTAGILGMSVLAYVGYPVLCELLLRGRSVGRLTMGTRVVRDDGGPVHVRQSLIRAVMATFEIWSTSGAVALTCSVIDRRSRRVGDLLAGTMVIQERMRTLSPDR